MESLRIEEIEDEDANRIQLKDSTNTAQKQVWQETVPLEHPYWNARDAAYVPPATQNVGVKAKVPVNIKRTKPAYHALPPIHDPEIAVNVYKQSMDTAHANHYHSKEIIILSTGSLLSS